VRAFVLAFMSLFLLTPAEAQQRKSAFVFSETDTDGHQYCGVNHEGISAAVASVLRSNGYQMAEKTDSQAMDVYVALTPVPISSGCAVSFKVEFSFFQHARSGWGDSYFGKLLLCTRSGIQTGSINNMQSNLRLLSIQATEMCIREEERKRNL